MPVSKYFLIEIPDGAVTARKIAAAAVITSKIADLNVTTEKLADESVTAAKLAEGVVGSTALDDESVTTAKLAPAAVTSSKLATDLKRHLWTSPVPGLTQGGGRDISFRFVNPWSVSAILVGLEVICAVKATQGTYTLALTKTSGSLNMLSSSTYDLTGLTNNTVASITLNGTAGNKTLTAGQDAVLTVSSSSAELDGEGLYFYALWELQDS